MRGERSGNGKERARGTAIHHSLASRSSRCHSTETLTNTAEMEAEVCHAQVGVRANQTEEWMDEKKTLHVMLLMEESDRRRDSKWQNI